MVREMGKMCFSLISEHKIINGRTRHASLSSDITNQNTRFHWSKISRESVALHYRSRIFLPAAILRAALKLAASQASRFRSTCSLAIKESLYPLYVHRAALTDLILCLTTDGEPLRKRPHRNQVMNVQPCWPSGNGKRTLV